MASDLMMYLNSVLVDGKPLDFSNTEVASGYAPFPVNNGVAMNIDTVMYAAEMNKMPWLSKTMQYEFYLYAIVKKKRYGKWAKKIEESDQENIELVSNHYSISNEKAKQYLKLLEADHLDTIRKAAFKGGSSNREKRK